MKRKLTTIFTLIFALVLSSAVFAACDEKTTPPPQSGDEVGVYYYDAEGSEWTITLSEECKFTYSVAGETKFGSYTLTGSDLALSFDGASQPEHATLESGVLTYNLSGLYYRFLLKKNFTVTFSANGAAFKTESVLNGKPVARPDTDPDGGEGKVFVGWYKDSSFKELYNFDRPVSGDLTVYARFVDASTAEREYTVTFDPGFGGEVTTRTTIDGKLYDLPVPKKDGDTFVGWWVSHYNDKEKLTYRYEEQTLTADTTLFAVWQSDAPYVSIGENEIVWSAEGVVNSYAVVFTGPDGEEIYNRESGVTTYAYNFAENKEGEYTVSVTVDGKTTTAYYLNKALSKANQENFRVEGDTFLFNPVENATEYTLNFVCGTDGHDHSAVSLGGETHYDFSGCELPEDGFLFTVTASAEGWLSSVSETWAYTRTLGTVADLSVDPDTDVAKWGAVENAASYYVTVVSNGATLFSANVHDTLSLDLSAYDAAAYTVTVYPIARGWKSPDAASVQYTKVRLATPENVHLEGVYVAWNNVPGAVKYEVKIGDGQPQEFSSNRFNFNEYVVTGQSSYRITVRALGTTDAATSFWSDALTAQQTFENTLTYEGGILKWDPAFGVSTYYVKVNEEGEEFAVTNANFTPVTLAKEGENVLYVAAEFADGSRSQWHTMTVKAYALFFDAQFGEAVPTQYYANGDPIKLPGANRTGYTFSGWYETQEGPQGGLPFEQDVFTEESNLTLYADWKAVSYSVFFYVGAYATESSIAPQQVAYDTENYRLPVPTSRSVEIAFGGWYSQPNGSGTQYTRYNGENISQWKDTAPKTLYAYWVEVFKFTKISDGYSVEKGPGISYVSEVCVPQTHSGNEGTFPVVQVNDFSNVTTLRSFTFYNTVTSVTVGSTGIAFSGCTSLEEIKVLPVDNVDGRYWDEDGVLLGKDPATGDTLVYLYPQNHHLEDNTYTIPEGVTRLTAGVFEDRSGVTSTVTESTLLHLVVPASVTQVDEKAFYNIMRVRTITFLDPEVSETARPLHIDDGAFEAMNSLDTINFPARLENFSTSIFFERSSGGELGRLRHVNIADGSEKFAMVEGLLTLKTAGNGRKLLYYPTPRREVAPDIGMTYATEIVIPEGITAIASDFLLRNPSSGASDPYICTALEHIETVTIAATVTEIEANAFREIVSSASLQFSGNRTGLKKVIFKGSADDQPLTIGEGAFYSNICLGEESSEFTLPENLAVLGAYAFGNIPGITTVNVNCGTNLPELNFSENAFAAEGSAHTSYIEVVNLGKDVNNVNIAKVFGGKVKAVNIDPENVNYTSADGVVFDKEMTEIVFFPDIKTEFDVPESISEIGANLFMGRTNLQSVVIPSTLTQIGSGAFASCTSLNTVTFTGEGGADLAIGDRAFYGCTALKKIELPARTRSLGSECFAGTTKKGFETVTLNEGLQTIGEKAFANSALKEITIPASVEAIRTTEASTKAYCKFATQPYSSSQGYKKIEVLQTFSGCSYLSKIDVAAASTHYASVNGVLCGKDENGAVTDLIYCPSNYEGENHVLNVPASIKKVWSHAFDMQGNTNSYKDTAYLTEIRFPDTVPELVFAEEAFTLAYNLVSVKMPNGLTEIGEGAFYNTNIDSLTIPNTVTLIHTGAFAYVSLGMRQDGKGREFNSLEFAPGGSAPLVLEGGYNTLCTSEITYGDGMFAGNPALTSITLPERLTEIGAFLFTDSKITSVHVPASVTTLGIGAFASGSSDGSVLTSVTFADGCALTEIPEVAFRQSAITSIVIPENVQTIAERAFQSTAALRTVTFNANLKTIKTNAFNGSGVQTANFAEGLQEVEEKAFAASGLTGTLELPASLKTIGAQAFGYNSKSELYMVHIKEVKFAAESQLETLGEWAFGYSPDLVSVTGLGTKLTKIAKNAFVGCKSLSTVGFAEGVGSLTEIGDSAFSGTAIQEFSVPESTETIKLGKNLFANNENPLTIHLSSTVNDLTETFVGVTLQQITVPEESEYFSVDPDQPILYDADESIILIYGDIVGTMTIRGKEVGASAFMGQKGITKIVISSTVATIGQKAFQDCVNLETVEIQNGSALTSIGANAFQNCTSLTSIGLNETRNLDTLGNNAFDGCEKLASVDLSRNEKLTSLGNYAFRGTTLLTKALLPKKLVRLGQYAFQNSGLTSIDLSAMEDLAELGNATGTVNATTTSYTFDGCENLSEVLLPKGLARIGGQVFRNCKSLTSINLPTELSIIAVEAFRGSGLESVVIPSGVTAIGTGVFAFCESLQTVTFESGAAITFTDPIAPSSSSRSTYGVFESSAVTNVRLSSKVQAIPIAMFYRCANLKQIELPDGVTRIAGFAFAETGLTKIEIPATVTVLGGNTKSNTLYAGSFADCKSLDTVIFQPGTGTISVTDKGTSTSSSTYKGVFEGSPIKNVTLNRITAIAKGMFTNSGLESIEIPQEVTSIKDSAFEGCASLAKVTFAPSESGVTLGASAFRSCGLETFEVPNSSSIGNFLLMDNTKLTTVTFATDSALTKISAGMFRGCTMLNSVTLPEGITEISYNAFRGTGLTTVTIPASVTKFTTSSTTLKSDSTDGHQFAECEHLTTVVFENGSQITDLGKMAFANCPELKTVNFGEESALANFGWLTFEGCPMYKPESKDLPAGVTTFALGMADLFVKEGDDTFTLPDQFTVVGERAFENSQLKEIKLHEGVTEIGAHAFAGTVFENFEIPATVTNIAYGAFANNTHLTKITIPASVTTLGNGSGTASTSSLGIFSGCTALSSVTFSTPTKLATLGNYMFYGCTALQSITLPDTITHLGTHTFEASGLTKIDLSNLTSLKSISAAANGSSATSLGYQFQNCEHLTQVTLPAGLTCLGGYVFKGCTALESIQIPSTVTLIANYCFDGCTALRSITIPSATTYIANYCFNGCTSLQTVTLNKNLSVLGQSTFKGCTNLQTIDFSQTKLKYIGATSTSSKPSASTAGSTFEGCTNLTQILLPETLQAISGSVFKGCTNLKTVDLPDSVTLIGNSCFENAGIEHIKLPAQLGTEGLGTKAFSGCPLHSVYVPSTYVPSTTASKIPAAEVFAGHADDFTIYTDMDADAFKARFSKWTEFNVVGDTPAENYPVQALS